MIIVLFLHKTIIRIKESVTRSEKGKYRIKKIFRRLFLFFGKKTEEDDIWSSNSSSGDEEDIFSKMTYEEIAVYVDTKARWISIFSFS